ncbi:hypothetical protein CHK_2355 [Christensenella hongkongensis]|uniref:Uncharacterized protein n=1 Tax=Christensenella hongkongensis TaxID=270498 RepID=A0A0M2NIM5_9FIRM|nr:hypothetical protein CHK_2355 [Christensenella hongkongensis]
MSCSICNFRNAGKRPRVKDVGVFLTEETWYCRRKDQKTVYN